MNRFFLCSALFYGASASCSFDEFLVSGNSYPWESTEAGYCVQPGNALCRNGEGITGSSYWSSGVTPEQCKAACDGNDDCQAYSINSGSACMLFWQVGVNSMPASFLEAGIGSPNRASNCNEVGSFGSRQAAPCAACACPAATNAAPLTGAVYAWQWSCHIKTGGGGGGALSSEGFAADECATCEWDGGQMKVKYMGEESRTDDRVQDGAKSNQQVAISNLHANFHCHRDANSDDCSCTCQDQTNGRGVTICQDEWKVEQLGYFGGDQMDAPRIVDSFDECKSLCIVTYGDNCAYIQFGQSQVPGEGTDVIDPSSSTDMNGHQCWIGDSSNIPARHNNADSNSVWSVQKPECLTHSL